MDNIVPFPAQSPLDPYALAIAFLEGVLPSEGVYFAGVRTKRGIWRDIPQPTIEDLRTYLFEADRDRGDAYFAVASYSSNANRKAKNVHELRAFRTEVDYGEGHINRDVYRDAREALKALYQFCKAVGLPDPIVVLSGGGLHVYWPLKDALGPVEWKRYSEGLKAACLAHGLKAGHECTADAARVLRLPGTTNRKIPGKPRLVTLDPRFLRIEPYDLARFDTLLDYAPVAAAGKNAEPLRLPPLPSRPPWLPPYEPSPAFPDLYPPADARLIADRCAHIGRMRDGLRQSYPIWFGSVGVVARCEDGESIAHEWSKRDERYKPEETQQKIDHWLKMTGPATCEYFSGCGSEANEICRACPHFGIIKSPIQLGEQRYSQQPDAATTGGADNRGTKRGALIWEKTAGGAIKPKSYANTALAIEALGITGRHDVFHDRKIISGDLPENLGPELSDAIVRAMRELIVARFNFDPGKENVQEALDRLCEKNRFNPVRDYFDGLGWDGIRRLDRVLIDYFGAEDTPLNRAFGRKTLLAAVRRARHPGCKFDTMPVLEGKQGTGKSTAIRILAGDDNFSDQPIKWEDQKQQQEAVRGVLIHEISELVGLRRADVEIIKSFLSRQSDRCRPAYGHYVEDRPRRCIFIGTTNNDDGLGYLADPSGGRRFWPVKTAQIDLEALRRDRDQLWGEAAALEASGETLQLDPSLYEAAAIEQTKRFAHEPWVELLRGVTGERVGAVERISTRKLLEVDLRLDAPQISRREYQRLAVAMTALGWSRPKDLRIPSEGSGTVKGYERAMAP